MEENIPKFNVGDVIHSIYAPAISAKIIEIKDGKYYFNIYGKKKYWPINRQHLYKLIK